MDLEQMARALAEGIAKTMGAGAPFAKQTIASIAAEVLAALQSVQEAQREIASRWEQEYRKEYQECIEAYGRAERAEAERDALQQRVTALEGALRKVRAHTSYATPTPELLAGLLASIERITEATLRGDDQ